MRAIPKKNATCRAYFILLVCPFCLEAALGGGGRSFLPMSSTLVTVGMAVHESVVQSVSIRMFLS